MMEDCIGVRYERWVTLGFHLLLVVQEVVGEIVANVAKNSTTEHRCRGVPVVEEDCMGELVERGCESNEEGRWHD